MLNISKQIHAGWDNTKVIPEAQVLYEAEIIPEGATASELKKFVKFSSKHNTIHTIDNVPMPGFTLYDVDKKNYSATDSTWLVIDPRGFITRITNKNLIKILRVSGITEGLIQQKCVWAREDSDTTLTLVPLSSTEYNLAVGNTELMEAKVSMDSVDIGDTVLLQNGLTGKYMGVLSLYGRMDRSYNNVLKAPSFLRKQIIEVFPGKFHYNTDIKILKVLGKSPLPMSREDSMTYINGEINHNVNCYFSQDTKFTNSFQPSFRYIGCVSVHAEPKVKYVLEEIEKEEAEELFYKFRDTTYYGGLVLENLQDKKSIIDFPWWGSQQTVNTTSFPIQDVAAIDDSKITLHKPVAGAMAYVTGAKPKLYSLDNFKKFYKIVKQVRAIKYI
jgi:hypothetical protein